jgi:predicted ATPase
MASRAQQPLAYILALFGGMSTDDAAQADGQDAVFVPLAPLSSANLIAPAIAGALGLSLSGAEAPAAQLLRYLSDRELLLVLDNFEHLLEGAALLLAILRETTGVTLLITSREPLKLRAEWVFDVEGLPAPAADDLGEIEGFDAVALFVQRAGQALARFELASADAPSIARICRLVAGMPLGIELAAAWVRSLSCAEIARAIELDLDVLTSEFRDVPDRHQSLRAVFNHSWALLQVDEQAILGRLAVFRGGFASEAAVEVAGATPAHLRALVDKSLLRRGPDEHYELHELVRQYAAERLRAAEAEDDASARHLAYFLALAQRLQSERLGLGARLSFQRLAAENDNLRAALEWCRLRNLITPWLRLAAALWFHLEASGALAEGLYWLEEALERAAAGWDEAGADEPAMPERGADTARSARAKALIGAANLRRRCGDYPQAEVHARRALAMCLDRGDEWGIAAAQHILGRALRDQGDFGGAAPLLEESLARYRALEDGEGTALLLGSLAIHYHKQGLDAQAQALAEESVALCREQGNVWTGAFQFETLGQIALGQGRYAQAQAHLEESLELFQDVGFKPGQANVLENLGQTRQAQGDFAAARAHFEACLVLRRLMGGAREPANLLATLEQVALAQGDQPAAQRFAAERQRWLAPAEQGRQAVTAS